MENLGVLSRGQGWPLSGSLVVGAGLLLLLGPGCGGTECGKGTVEIDGVCQLANVLTCGIGFNALGGKCVPAPKWVEYYCGKDSKYNPILDRCVGTGGAAEGCPQDKLCTETPSGGPICLQGRALVGTELLAKWAGDAKYKKPTPISSTDGALIRVYDPIDFVAHPTTAQPLAESAIDDNGCFVIKNIKIPFSGLFAISANDTSPTGTKWAFAGLGHAPVADQNSTGLELPAITETVAAEWGHDFLKLGSFVMVFLDQGNQGVDGVEPVYEGKKPVGGKFPGTDYSVFYMSADPTKPSAIVDPSATKTTKSGVVIIPKIPIGGVTGEKGTCQVESKLGGSTPGVLFFGLRQVTGC